MSPDSTAPATVQQAADAFQKRASLLTPPEHEHASEQPPEASGESEVEADATPSPEDQSAATTEQSAEAETTEAQTETPALYSVAGPDGKEVQVTLEELRGGYLRQADYTRKTQAIAETRKQAETEAQTYREQRTQYQDGLSQLKKALEALTPPEPDWAKLRQESPDEYAIRRLEWNEHQDRIAKVKQAEQQAAWDAEQDRAKQYGAKLIEEEKKLLEAVPEWKDTAKGRAELTTIRDYATSRGFTETELPVIFGDHRSILLVRDAMRWRDLQAKKPDAQRKIEKIKAATPGGQQKPVPGQAEKRALDTLAKSGRVDDAAKVFLTRSGASGSK